jgi:hypothetical protein
MKDLEIWALMGIVATVGGILVRIVSSEAKKAINRLDEMVKGINQLAITINTHEQRIITLQEANNNSSHRMNDHAVRLRNVEQDVAILKKSEK